MQQRVRECSDQAPRERVTRKRVSERMCRGRTPRE